MHLLRIRLNNWRGVEQAEILLDAGITIVEGDNEAGKSSFIEALNLLFRERDSTKKQELKRVTPKGVDAGSSVEVELTTGEYHLTYSKTFNKKTSTTLFIHKPAAVQLMGAEAHDRVLQILDETIDFSLWQAIQLEQGGEFSQVNFKNSDSLAQALDNAAGGSGAGEGESALLQKAKAEYLKYYTERAGKETGELAALREREKTLQQSSSLLAESLAELDGYVDESARVTTQLKALKESMPSMTLNVLEYEKQLVEIVAIRQRLSACESQAQTCEYAGKELLRQIKEREGISAEIKILEQSIASNEKESIELEQVFNKAKLAFDESTQERERLLVNRQTTQRQLHAVESSIQLRDRMLQVKSLEQRYQMQHAAYLEVTEVEKALANCRVDDVAVNRIEKLEQLRREQQMQIGGHSARIRLQFIKEASVVIGESLKQYQAGEELITDSSTASTLKVDDTLRVEITPAADSVELTLDHQRTVESLNEILAQCGLASVGDAIAAHRKRSELTGRLRELQRAHKKQEKQQSLEALKNTIEANKKTIAEIEFQAAQSSGELSFADVSALEEGQQTCRRLLEEQERSLAAARDMRDQRQQQCAAAETKYALCKQGHITRLAEVNKLKEKLAVLELDTPLESLHTVHQKAVDELNIARKALETVRLALTKSQSGQVDLLLTNAKQSLQRAQTEFHDLELRQAANKARLDQLQAEGLHEKHQSVLAEHDDNSARLRQLDRRARAASTLWKTLLHHQRQAQLSYARPLAERVANMGKVVFGDSFSVELSESLNIVSRTLNGTTVPFDDLSGGAREQLGILLRLAAAQLVSKTEAMPLILDDTLGHTDARRLETMGAILNSAAQTAQIVVMTCYPARYHYVGGAKVVKLHRQAGWFEVER